MLNVESDHGYAGPEAAWERAIEKMMRGGLRMAASQLLEQGSQRSAGQGLLFDGLIVIEGIREANAADRRAAERKSSKPSVRPVKR